MARAVDDFAGKLADTIRRSTSDIAWASQDGPTICIQFQDGRHFDLVVVQRISERTHSFEQPEGQP